MGDDDKATKHLAEGQSSQDKEKWSYSPVQHQASIAAGANTWGELDRMPETGDISIDIESPTLQYYGHLESPEDDDAESMLLDQDLEELYEFANVFEGGPEGDDSSHDAGELKLLSRVFYYAFRKSGAVGDIQRSIKKIEQAVATTHIDDANYALQLRDLVTLLMKKYESTVLLEDLERAIHRAEEMTTITPLSDPNRFIQLVDLAKMKYMRYRLSHLPEDFDEAQLIAIEAISLRDASPEKSKAKEPASHSLWKDKVTSAPLTEAQKCITIEASSKGSTAVLAFRSLVDRSITAWHSINYVGLDKNSAIYDHSKILRCLSSIESLVETHQFWFFQLRKSFLQQKQFMKWDPDRLDEFILLPVEYGFVNKKDCFFVSHYWRNPKHPDPDGEDFRLVHGDLNTADWAYVWVDWTCLPQFPLNEMQQRYLDRMLPCIPTIVRNCGFEWRYPKFEPRLWVLLEVAEYVLNTHGTHTVTDDIAPFISHVSKMVQEGVSSVVDRYKYKCAKENDSQLVISSMEILVILTRVVPDVRKRLEIYRWSDIPGLGIFRDYESGIEIDKAKGVISANGIIYKFTPIYPVMADCPATLANVSNLKSTSEDDLNCAAQLRYLANKFASKFESTKEAKDFEEAIRVAELALKSTPKDHPRRAPCLIDLGSILMFRYEQIGEIKDLEKAIQVTELAVQLIPKDHPDRTTSLSNLGLMLIHRCQHTGDIKDIEKAIQVIELVLESTPENRSNWVAHLSNLGARIESRYENTGEIQDLEEAIRVGELVLKYAPNQAVKLSILGIRLRSKYKRTSEIKDLEEAVRLAKLAVTFSLEDDPNRAGYLTNLGNALEDRYEWTGEEKDLAEAIRLAELAVKLRKEASLHQALCLSNLGIKLENQYGRTGDIKYIEEAIRLEQLAVELTSKEPSHQAAFLSYLGSMFRSRYERTGDPKYLDEATRVAREAIQVEELAAKPVSEDLPNSAGYLDTLGLNLFRRYEHTSEMKDLEEAIRLSKLAVKSTQESDINYTAYLHNLAIKFQVRYDRTRELKDLEEGIRLAELVIKSTPSGHTLEASRLNALSQMLRSRYLRTSEMKDLENAVLTTRLSLDSITEDHPQRAIYLDTLGTSLKCQYDQTGEIKVLDEAIRTVELAVELTPEDVPHLPILLNNLGLMLESRYGRIGEIKDQDDACTCFFKAWMCTNGIPFYRVRPATRLLKLLPARKELEKATKLARDVIDLLPIVNRRFLDFKDRQFVLSTFSGIAADACAILLEAQEPDQALHYLEQGRAVILGQLMDDRSDVSILSREHPDLAHAYERLCVELNTPLRDLDTSNWVAVSRRRRTASEELSSCIKEIRSLQGYSRFLLGQTATEMQECAEDGSIVVVNVTEMRSDAIIVSRTGTKTLRLPELDARKVKEWLQKKWWGRRSDRGKRNQEYWEYLSWLWKTCVKQVLYEIDNEPRPTSDLLRIWWIGTGLASSIPFHAAGEYSLGSAENAYHRTISSYAPSLRALSHSRDRLKSTKAVHHQLLITTMTTTPRLTNLPGVIEEKNGVIQATNKFLPIEKLDQPNVSQVIESLKRCTIAHFACHGYTDHADPSSSGLVFQLSLGSESPRQDVLTVQKISEIKSNHAQIAYLSACSTAENKAAEMADEVIHVVSSFQVVGFAHVIGCLWPSLDSVCVEVARDFYSSLFRQRGAQWESREVAMALREAIMKIRARDFGQPLNWAQFVHYGV